MMSTPFQIYFLKFMWNIYGMHLRSHMQTLLHAPCMHLRRQKESRAHQTSIMIFYEKNLQKQIGYLNSSRENIQFQKKNHPKQSPESKVMIFLKSTKFQHFSGNGRMVFKISSKIYLDIIHYKKIKWIYVEISMIHILHQICADIYIFNKIFKEHKLAQLRGLLGVKDMVA
jgi:hypothetical protein